jgi:hypothetical protein
MLKVALLGAPATGKTQLASALLAARPGLCVTVIDGCPIPPEFPRRIPFDLALLMGLDLPRPSSDKQAQDATDSLLRNALAQTGIAYQVVYGQGPERLLNALRALGALASRAPENEAVSRNTWVWSCDTCSDPQCERRLLTDLLAMRAG